MNKIEIIDLETEIVVHLSFFRNKIFHLVEYSRIGKDLFVIPVMIIFVIKLAGRLF